MLNALELRASKPPDSAALFRVLRAFLSLAFFVLLRLRVPSWIQESVSICVICGSYDVPSRRWRLLLRADRLDRRDVLGLVVEQLEPIFLGVALREDLVLLVLDPHRLLNIVQRNALGLGL